MRRICRAPLSLGVLGFMLSLQPLELPAQELPPVRLIATGGTISQQAGARLSASELVRSVPGLNNYVAAEAEQFSNLASAQLTLAHWIRLSNRINQLFAQRPDLAGIVVSSGTDTLEETAYFLHLTVQSDRPVVVVGSQRSPTTLGYDGAANLLQAFRVAAAPESKQKGVLVVANEEVNSAREVTKTDALRLHTFRAGDYGLLGVVNRDRVIYYRDTVRRHTFRSEFDLSGIQTLPRVDILMVYQDASGDLIRAAVDNGARGVVIAAAGAGATSGTQEEAIAYAMSRDVVVVSSTRTAAGRIAFGEIAEEGQPNSEVWSNGRIHPVSAEDLQPVKARILLMLALTRTSDPAEIQRMFNEY